jgi:hypothetical protein
MGIWLWHLFISFRTTIALNGLTFKLCYFNFYCSVLIMANVRQVVSNNNSDTLDFLLRNKFSSLFYDDKLFVKDLKRPRPAMSNLVCN